NVGTCCNRKSAQPVLYTKGAHTGHKKRMANNNIADIRKAKGWTQQQLADAIGTTINTLGKLERGTRRLNQDWVDRIAVALDVSPGAIFGNTVSVSTNDKSRSVTFSVPRPLDMQRAPDQMPTRSAYADVG